MESLAEEQGYEPGALIEREDLLPGLEIVWRAFNDLGGDRHVGVTASSQIPFVSIDAWARRYQIADEEFARFHYLLKEMDAVVLTYKAPKETS